MKIGVAYPSTFFMGVNEKKAEKTKKDIETKYTQAAKAIKDAEEAAAVYYKSQGLNVERQSSWYVDENGNIKHFAYVKKEDKLNQSLREQSAETSRKTANDELVYLTNKHKGCSFIGIAYKQSMKYGSSDTTNIAVSPHFLKRMAENPELEKEYEEQFALMQQIDKQISLSHKLSGKQLVARGWVIDKDGGISCWSITKSVSKKHYGKAMTDYTTKLLKKKTARRKQAAKGKAKAEIKAETEQKQKDALEKLQACVNAAANTTASKKIDILIGEEDTAPEETKDTEALLKQNEKKATKQTSVGGKVGVNAAKRARQIAAAKTRSQLLQVISLLQEDLRECEEGLRNDMCDEAEIEKVKALLAQARQRMGQVKNEEPTPQEEMEFSLSSLM